MIGKEQVKRWSGDDVVGQAKFVERLFESLHKCWSSYALVRF